jgi:hypothetical protein
MRWRLPTRIEDYPGPPEARGAGIEAVQINIGEPPAGYVVDLTEPGSDRREVVSPADDPRVIEGSAEEPAAAAIATILAVLFCLV